MSLAQVAQVARFRSSFASRPARTLLAGGLILLLCLLAYLPVLNGKFLWDDLYLVGANPFFKSPMFLLEVFRHYLFLDSFSLYYRPLQNVSYMLDYLLWNKEEFGYHFSNVLFHAASAFLLFLVLRRCLKELAEEKISPAFVEGAAFGTSLLWAVHPIHNAAVAYVAGRADSLAMMFALAGWLLFTSGWTGWRGAAAGVAAPLCILLALCAKEIAFIWIGLFTLYLFVFEKGRSPRGKLLAVGSLLGVLGIYLLLRHLPGSRPPQQGLPVFPMATRLMLMLRALGDYTSLIFYPGNLHMERTVWNGPAYDSVTAWQQNLRGEYLSLLGLGTLALFAYACWSKLPGRKMRLFGVSWFVLGFLPISNLFPLNAQVAEHWIYMASVGFLIMLAGFACAAPVRSHQLLMGAAALAVMALSARTAFRAAEWADPEIFFKQTIAAGGRCERVNLNLANIYAERGDMKKAEAVLRETAMRFPDYPNARVSLGINLLRQGRKEEAEHYLAYDKKQADTLASAAPQSWSAAVNLAHMQYTNQHPDAAVAILDEAAGRYPEIWEIVNQRAQILTAWKGVAAAEPAVARFAAGHWWHLESHQALGQLRAAAGDYAGARAAYAEAAALDIHDPKAFEGMAQAEVLADRLPEALEAQAAAIERSPDEPHEYIMLAMILNEMHQPRQAMAAARKADLLRASLSGS